jgi:hypothetical protein
LLLRSRVAAPEAHFGTETVIALPLSSCTRFLKKADAVLSLLCVRWLAGGCQTVHQTVDRAKEPTLQKPLSESNLQKLKARGANASLCVTKRLSHLCCKKWGGCRVGNARFLIGLFCWLILFVAVVLLRHPTSNSIPLFVD